MAPFLMYILKNKCHHPYVQVILSNNFMLFELTEEKVKTKITEHTFKDILFLAMQCSCTNPAISKIFYFYLNLYLKETPLNINLSDSDVFALKDMIVNLVKKHSIDPLHIFNNFKEHFLQHVYSEDSLNLVKEKLLPISKEERDQHCPSHIRRFEERKGFSTGLCK